VEWEILDSVLLLRKALTSVEEHVVDVAEVERFGWG
jgi:hypothetical protein